MAKFKLSVRLYFDEEKNRFLRDDELPLSRIDPGTEVEGCVLNWTKISFSSLSELYTFMVNHHDVYHMIRQDLEDEGTTPEDAREEKIRAEIYRRMIHIASYLNRPVGDHPYEFYVKNMPWVKETYGKHPMEPMIDKWLEDRAIRWKDEPSTLPVSPPIDPENYEEVSPSDFDDSNLSPEVKHQMALMAKIIGRDPKTLANVPTVGPDFKKIAKERMAEKAKAGSKQEQKKPMSAAEALYTTKSKPPVKNPHVTNPIFRSALEILEQDRLKAAEMLKNSEIAKELDLMAKNKSKSPKEPIDVTVEDHPAAPQSSTKANVRDEKFWQTHFKDPDMCGRDETDDEDEDEDNDGWDDEEEDINDRSLKAADRAFESTDLMDILNGDDDDDEEDEEDEECDLERERHAVGFGPADDAELSDDQESKKPSSEEDDDSNHPIEKSSPKEDTTYKVMGIPKKPKPIETVDKYGNHPNDALQIIDSGATSTKEEGEFDPYSPKTSRALKAELREWVKSIEERELTGELKGADPSDDQEEWKANFMELKAAIEAKLNSAGEEEEDDDDDGWDDDDEWNKPLDLSAIHGEVKTEVEAEGNDEVNDDADGDGDDGDDDDDDEDDEYDDDTNLNLRDYIYGTAEDKQWTKYLPVYSKSAYTSTEDPDNTRQYYLDYLFETYDAYKLKGIPDYTTTTFEWTSPAQSIRQCNEEIEAIAMSKSSNPLRREDDLRNTLAMAYEDEPMDTSSPLKIPKAKPSVHPDYPWNQKYWDQRFEDLNHTSDQPSTRLERDVRIDRWLDGWTAQAAKIFVDPYKDHVGEIVINDRNICDPTEYKTPTHNVRKTKRLGISSIVGTTFKYYRSDMGRVVELYESELPSFSVPKYKKYLATGKYETEIEDHQRENYFVQNVIPHYRGYKALRDAGKTTPQCYTTMALEIGLAPGFEFDGRAHIVDTFFAVPGAIEFYGYRTTFQLPNGVFVFIVDDERGYNTLTNLDRVYQFEIDVGQTYIVVKNGSHEVDLVKCLSQLLIYRNIDMTSYYTACAVGRDKVDPRLCIMPLTVLPCQVVDPEKIEFLDRFPHMASVIVYADKANEVQEGAWFAKVGTNLYPAAKLDGKYYYVLDGRQFMDVDGRLQLPNASPGGRVTTRSRNEEKIYWEDMVCENGKSLAENWGKVINSFRFIPKKGPIDTIEGAIANSYWNRMGTKNAMETNAPEWYKKRDKELDELERVTLESGVPEKISQKYFKNVFPEHRRIVNKERILPICGFVDDPLVNDRFDHDIEEFFELMKHDPFNHTRVIPTLVEPFIRGESIPELTDREEEIIAKFGLFECVPAIKQRIYKSDEHMYKLRCRFDKNTADAKFDKANYTFKSFNSDGTEQVVDPLIPVDRFKIPENNRIYDEPSEEEKFKELKDRYNFDDVLYELVDSEVKKYYKDDLKSIAKGAKTMYDLYQNIDKAKKKIVKDCDKLITSQKQFENDYLKLLTTKYHEDEDLTIEEYYEKNTSDFEKSVFTPSDISYAELTKKERKYLVGIQKDAIYSIVEMPYVNFLAQYDEKRGSFQFAGSSDLNQYWSNMYENQTGMHRIGMVKAREYDRKRGDHISEYEKRMLITYRKEHRADYIAEAKKAKAIAKHNEKARDKMSRLKFVPGKGMTYSKKHTKG